MPKQFWWGVALILLGSLVFVQVRPSAGAEDIGLSQQIAQVLKNQETILKDLEEIKGELTKIRMRVH